MHLAGLNTFLKLIIYLDVAVCVILQQKRKEMEAISNMHLEPERVHKVKIVMQVNILLFYALFAQGAFFIFIHFLN